MKRQERLLKKEAEAKKRVNHKVDSILFPSFLDESYKDDAYIVLKNINKIYPNNVQAVFDFNLFVKKHEFIVFVGPSGCGKSTTIRMICGLEEITSGSLFIDGVYSNELAPKDRNIAMVFQSYALYPHMNVYDNLAYSLKIRKNPVKVFAKDGRPVMWTDKKSINKCKKRIKELKMVIRENEEDMQQINNSKDKYARAVYEELINYYEERTLLAKEEIAKQEELIDYYLNNKVQKIKYRRASKKVIEEKVNEAAKILEIEPFLTRKPKALSGGQRQRVALGRAIIRDAKVFLMDEPLSNLDAKLRVQMRAELVALHDRIEATTIYVTHDQTEAMTMADRIVVMKDGVIQQTGTPKEIYDTPTNLFVATFIGAPPMNIIECEYDKGRIVFKNKHEHVSLFDKAVSSFYTKEYKRIQQVIKDLEVAVLDTSSKNHEVYKLALEKAQSLIKVFGERKKGKFSFYFGIRPEHITISKRKNKDSFPVTINIVELLGSEYYLHTKIDNQSLVIKTSANDNYEAGDKVYISFNYEKAHGFDIETEQTIF